MVTTKNIILITGGSSGIGFAMAEKFIEAGNEVLICGRRESKLTEAKQKLPNVHIRVCDLANATEREELFRWAVSKFPGINMLVNNAGIQKEVDFVSGAADVFGDENEIEINLTAGIHLASLFVPYFLKQDRECAVVNVTSGLAFIPLKIVPVYCATKSALRTFSISLRSQLAGTNVRVFEIAPPIVKTDLHRGAQAQKQSERGISAAAVAGAAFKAIKKNRYEAIVGEAKTLKGASRLAPKLFHKLLNKVAAG